MMKKWIALQSLLLLMVLVACGGETPVEVDDPVEVETPIDEGPSIAEQLEAAAGTIDLFENGLLDSLTLPMMIEDFEITWSSENPSLINEEGVVNRPSLSEGDQTINMTATFSKDGIQYSAVYEATILAFTEEEISNKIIQLIEEMPFFSGTISERIALINAIDGVNFDYSIPENPYLKPDGVVFKPLAIEGPQSIDIEITGTQDGVSETLSTTLEIKSFAPLGIIEERELEFVPIDGEFTVEPGTMMIYTMNNSLPYVDLTDFMSTISGAIIWSSLDILTTDTTYTIRLVSEADPDDDLSEDILYQLTFDFENHTATVNYYSFFGAILASTATDFGRGLEFIDFESNRDTLEPVVFDLPAYMMELYRHEDQYLVPFHLANLFLSGSVYDVYYNGDEIFGQDTYEFRASIRRFNSSSLNTEDMPYDLKEMTYHYMAFMMNYFYGLKNDFEIDDFYDVLVNYRNSWFSSVDNTHYRTILNVVLSLDDLHTSHVMNGPYTRTSSFDPSTFRYGPRSSLLRGSFQQLANSNFCLLDELKVEYLSDETVAILHIPGFNNEATEFVETAMAEIDEKGTIEKIVVNLACNTGGVIGTAWQILGYLSDDPFEYYSKNAGDGLQSKTTFTSENTTEREYEWFVLISPVTYSAANLFASMAKDMGLATIIGTQSSGGAASVKPMIMTNGTVIFISSPNILANSAFESIELGVPVDISISVSALSNNLRNRQTLLDALE